MNTIITPEEFARRTLEAMNQAEDEAGIPRGTLIKEWVKHFNTQFDDPPAAESEGKK